MTPHRHPNLRGLLRLAVVCIFFNPGAIFAQDDEEPVRIFADQTDLFRNEFFRNRIKPLRNPANLLDDPQHTIIVLLGEKSAGNYINHPNIRWAVEAGASILIASDQKAQLTGIFNVEITGETLIADEADCHMGRFVRPFVRPYGTPFEQIDDDSPGKLFQDLAAVGDHALATNIPSVLRLTPRLRGKAIAEGLAGYPLSSQTANRKRPFDHKNDHFAAGGKLGKGRFLILADHSIFVNGMVWREDNANYQFAQGCVKWLVGAEKKKYCFFVEEGKIQTEFELVLPEESMLMKFLKAMKFVEKHGNTLTQHAEKNNWFNEFLLKNVGLRPILRAVLIAFTIFVAAFGLLMFVRSRANADPARTLVTPELAAMIPRGSVIQQRFNSLIELENVYEAARQLVRDFFAGLGAEPDEKGVPPQLMIEDGYIDEAGLRRRMMRLWRIGFAPESVKIALDEWPKLMKDLKDVLTDADDGWWKFAVRSH